MDTPQRGLAPVIWEMSVNLAFGGSFGQLPRRMALTLELPRQIASTLSVN